MASKRTSRNRSIGSRFSVAVVIALFLLVPFVYFGRGQRICSNQAYNSAGPNKQFPKNLQLQDLKSLISKEVIDVIVAGTNDLGPLSLDNSRKNNLSASWRLAGEMMANSTSEIGVSGNGFGPKKASSN